MSKRKSQHIPGEPFISTGTYHNHCGKEPSGEGRWRFRRHGEKDVVTVSGMYSDAAKRVIAEAKRDGFTGTISLIP